MALALVLGGCSPHGTTPSGAPTRPFSDADVRLVQVDALQRPDFHFEMLRLSGSTQKPAVTMRRPLRVETLKTERVLLFVPGYATGVAHGAAEAASIARIVGKHTAVVLAHWGSRGKKSSYRRDSILAARNATAFGHALEYVRRMLPKAEIDIFAHSMGGRVAVRGLAQTLKDGHPVAVRHLVLAAPDVVIADYLSLMRQAASVGRATIYVSRRDRALLLSAALHLHHRLGQVAVERLNFPRTDIIDVSAEDRSPDGHGYALHDPSILNDIDQVISGAAAPHRQWCESKLYAGVWVFVPAARRISPALARCKE